MHQPLCPGVILDHRRDAPCWPDGLLSNNQERHLTPQECPWDFADHASKAFQSARVLSRRRQRISTHRDRLPPFEATWCMPVHTLYNCKVMEKHIFKTHRSIHFDRGENPNSRPHGPDHDCQVGRKPLLRCSTHDATSDRGT